MHKQIRKRHAITAILVASVLAGAHAHSDSALEIDATGNVGIGTSTPISTLNVFRSDGSASLTVEEASATPAARTLFKLVNAGNTKFEIEESSSGEVFAFTYSGTDFRISRQGSGKIEFRVFNNGNAEIAGLLQENSDRNAKMDIIAVDPQAVLQQLTQLPIAEWAYKDAPHSRHIGPMAQDFHAAFNTGTSETSLATMDIGGVTIASIQALAAHNSDLQATVQQLETQNQQLSERLAQLERTLQRLAQEPTHVGALQAMRTP